jgi:hypothetical protein
VSEAAREHGIELELLQALIATESGFDPAAVSPKGAVGLMQVMPATAQRYGLAGDARAPIEKKAEGPAHQPAHRRALPARPAADVPGRLELALAAYNAGEGAVQRAGNRIPNYRETQNYVRTVMQLYTMLKPVPAAAAAPAGPQPRRVHMELPGPAGTNGRRNLPAGLAAVAPLEGAGTPAAVVHD